MKKRIIVGIIYLILLAIVIAISLSIFPAWKSSGGFWTLFGIAAVTVLAFVEKGVSLWNKSEEEDKEEEKLPEAKSEKTSAGVNVEGDVNESVIVTGNNNIVTRALC